MIIACSIGLALALAVSVFAMRIGLDRDRAFYPSVLLVVASYYLLFAVMGGDRRALIEESIIVALFVVAAAVGFKRNSWLVVVGLAAHGVMDSFHGSVVSNGGVPGWWPAFCMTYDLAAAAFLAWTLHRSPALAKPRREAEA
ncbi:MAG TPA: hypothetical protein VGO46_12835 [Gemmatimonadaceae bacterium]|jgi:hypothetical protein|nr:hypothetical protein [Gemmatimonadaceae bacterium]